MILGLPIALQDLLVGMSFLIILAIVNALGLTASAGVGVSFLFGVAMFYISFFHGDLLSAVFANEAEVIAASAEYLKSYAIDCLLTCFLFCFIGFFNGIGLTRFVMIQGIVGAFLVRVPVSFFMSRVEPVSLFRIELATPCSTVVQIILCLICMKICVNKKEK